MILAEESAMFNGVNPFANDEKGGSKTYDLPFYFIGFKSAAPEFTLRTHIWASLRAQTLYRTVSGIMNYSKAIKLLYHVENPEVVQLFGGNTDRLERELEPMARRKFKFVVCNVIQNSTRKNTRTPRFCCEHTLISKSHILKKNWRGRKEVILAFFRL